MYTLTAGETVGYQTASRRIILEEGGPPDPASVLMECLILSVIDINEIG